MGHVFPQMVTGRWVPPPSLGAAGTHWPCGRAAPSWDAPRVHVPMGQTSSSGQHSGRAQRGTPTVGRLPAWRPTRRPGQTDDLWQTGAGAQATRATATFWPLSWWGVCFLPPTRSREKQKVQRDASTDAVSWGPCSVGCLTREPWGQAARMQTSPTAKLQPLPQRSAMMHPAAPGEAPAGAGPPGLAAGAKGWVASEDHNRQRGPSGTRRG